MTISPFGPARDAGPVTTTGHEGDQPARQVAALVWRQALNDFDVLLITSKTTRRWILPKGWLIDGKSPVESALQEAFEEAGVAGRPRGTPLGTYRYDKALDDGSLLPCVVDVFAIPAGRLLDQWPEMTRRRRRWYSASVAATLVAEPELAGILGKLDGELPSREAADRES